MKNHLGQHGCTRTCKKIVSGIQVGVFRTLIRLNLIGGKFTLPLTDKSQTGVALPSNHEKPESYNSVFYEIEGVRSDF